ncbi:hypothetical protein LOK49_LG02G00289 [Camellia lanceoleosa]|uniref:Uncharacterized protein n=1 Tax=Camellia lanceoleosa TaxID=1840588 RepID=A0ACC0II86_9ERIC|nr:hypothetical protein LOK49_LG02G00289 [Camellia lanceoleosa]
MKEVATSSSVGDAKKEAELVPKGLLRGSARRKGKPRLDEGGWMEVMDMMGVCKRQGGEFGSLGGSRY